ncbi:Uncharacterised protein [Yersinia mollaretii]|nr:Uncharacterised protein [Yersinia mollaretii]
MINSLYKYNIVTHAGEVLIISVSPISNDIEGVHNKNSICESHRTARTLTR